MPIAITEDHQSLGETAADLAERRDLRGAARALLDGAEEKLPEFWPEFAEVGWLGLHVPEDHGGSGYGLEELVVVVEELGRMLTPGPFVPTVIASALVTHAGDDDTAKQLLSGLADGSETAAIALEGELSLDGDRLTGTATFLSGALATLLVAEVGDDVAIVEVGDGITVDTPPPLDVSRSSSRISFDGAPATVLAGAGQLLVDISRVILGAEAVGMAREATNMAAEYATARKQFGRVIGTFQAVKHHCANMAVATELATSAVWDAARAAVTGGEQLRYAAAVAGTLAAPAADLCANLNTQVHGGIGMTWEHDAHLYMRRATTLLHFLDPDRAARDLTELTRQGVQRAKAVELPPDAEPIRQEVRSFLADLEGLSKDEQRAKMVETGYVMPQWPKPYGRAAGAVEQLVIEEEFRKAGVRRPDYGITAWNILTIIQYGTQDQLDRWVEPALNQDVIWCQLFSEPDAGSDAAGIKTRGTRVDGGWLVNGQKVWTSGAHVAGMGFATVRTNPDVPKHEGITMMAIDMNADGVEVRPIKMPTGQSEFNEVYFDDVFVPDDDVVGPVDGGWTVARTTLGNESVSIGGGGGGMAMPGEAFIAPFDMHPERLSGGEGRLGRYIANHQAMGLLNLRSANRAVAGGEPGPEGAMAKLILSENLHEAAAIFTELNGDNSVFLDDAGRMSNMLVLFHRGISIAGGTSEIKRNQIGERILGLPRDPLIK